MSIARRIAALAILSAGLLFLGSAPSMADSFPVCVGIGAGCVNEFMVTYNGFSDDGAIPGLSAEAIFSDFGFAYDNINDRTVVTFNFSLENISAAPIDASRVSGLGFFTSPDIFDPGDADNAVSGIFDNVTLDGNIANGIKNVEFCFSNNNCAGGASGGVTLGNIGYGSATLYYGGEIIALQFDKMYARYQSIYSTTLNIRDGSGTGIGTPDLPPYENPPVPEPASVVLLGLGLLGLGIWKFKRT